MVTTRKIQPGKRRLQFHEKLVGKALSTDALQRKLKALHAELADLDQDSVETSSLAAVSKELISTSILLHKDKGVKAYAACCLADLLRLYAPDAPYTAAELKDIFQFFSRQLYTGLKTSNGPHFTEYFYLLESLSNVKSVVLVCDLPQADELMSEIFRNFFDLSKQDIPTNVFAYLGDILVALVEECNSLPQDVLEILLAQFLEDEEKSSSTKGGFRLAVAVCIENAEKLQRYVSQYFTDIILQHGKGEDLDDLRAAHNLINHLNRSCPALLLNVVPQLEEELRVDELDIRLLATETLGAMFAEKMPLGSGDLPKKYPSTWRTWLLRQNDKAAAVRVALLDALPDLLLNHPEQAGEVEEVIQRKLLDPEEKVRVAACKVCSRLDYDALMQRISAETLKAIGGRVIDKRPSVRHEAATCLAKLYSYAYQDLQSSEEQPNPHVTWIPDELLHALAQPSPDIRGLIETIFCAYILPLPTDKEDDTQWSRRLVTLLRFVGDKALGALFTLAGLQLGRTNVLETYITYCESSAANDNPEAAKKLQISIQHLAAHFSEPSKAADDLWTFAKMNDKRLYKMLRVCVDTQTNIKTLTKGRSDFFGRMESNAPSTISTFRSLWLKFAPWVVNVSSIPELVRTLQRTRDDHLQGHIRALMAKISKCSPVLLQPHVGELAKALIGAGNELLAEVSLQTLSAVFVADPKSAPSDRRLVDKVSSYAEGTSPRHAKFAARLLSHTRNKAQLSTTLTKSIAAKLNAANPDYVVGHLSALAELAISAPDAFESCSDVIMLFILKDLFMRNQKIHKTEDEWAEDSEVPLATRAKEYALRICTNRCLSHADGVQATEIAKPVISLLCNTLESGGMPFQGVQQSLVDKSRLRARAAASLLKLARIVAYDMLIGAKFLMLALTAQDTCFGVRLFFINKLVKYGARSRLQPRFNVIPFLTVHDPENEPREKARSYVLNCMRRLPRNTRVACFEMIFPRLLHVLAHHPDFSVTPDDLSEIARYIRFYLDLVCTSENMPLLWHLASRLKTVQDVDVSFSENLYVISELAQHLLKRLAAEHNWSISSYPAKVDLPGDVFVRFRDPAEAAMVQRKMYLPENILAQLHTEPGVKPTRVVPIRRKRVALADKENIPGDRSSPSRRRKRQRKGRPAAKDEFSDDSPPSETERSDSEAGKAAKAEENSEESELTSIDEDEEEEEQLGRGARGKAKAKATRKAKKLKTHRLSNH